MKFELPKLSFSKDALVPYISAETFDYHYGKHHQAYVDNLNKLIVGTPFADLPLIDIIKKASGPIFNNAAQHWNHSFYWECLCKPAAEKIPVELESALNATFGSVAKFKEEFAKSAVGLFGSGWTWLVCEKTGKLSIVNSSNAENPLTAEKTPLLTCDVWEHAYYIDYRNARAKYLEAYWNVVNWDFIARNFAKVRKF
jgi:superoxide dismutase, Fe-Mn family